MVTKVTTSFVQLCFIYDEMDSLIDHVKCTHCTPGNMGDSQVLNRCKKKLRLLARPKASMHCLGVAKRGILMFQFFF